MSKSRKKLYLVDGSSYIFRAFYAIRSLSNSKGLPTNALYGFTRMILKLIKEEKPDMLGVVFDTEEDTFRDELFEDYKANRSEPPDDLIPQFPYFQPIVEAFNIKNLTMPGFEADDVIGTVASKAVRDGYDVVIVTSDKDFMQLVGDNIELYDTMKERRIGRPEVKKKFGVEPCRVIDVMSLIGDSSDNIPGVKGIGDKGASALINQFGTLDNLLANKDKVSNARAKTALRDGEKNALLSRQLVTIKLDVPIEYEWSEFDISDPNTGSLKKLFGELEFFKLLRELLPDEGGKKTTADYKIVASKDELSALTSEFVNSPSVSAFFYEGGNGYVGAACASEGGTPFYIPIAHQTLEEIQNLGRGILQEFFGQIKAKTIYIYDSKDVLKYLNENGVDFALIKDVRLMSYVINPEHPADLLTLGQQVLGIIDQRPKTEDRRLKTVNEAAVGACSSAELTLRLAEKFEDELSSNKSLSTIFSDIEMPLMMILAKMEDKGILIDRKLLADLSKEYDAKLGDLEENIYSKAGEKFKINSPKQLSHVLFEKLKLPVVKKTKTGYSTDANVLTQLALEYDLPRLILEYRSLSKLKSTYIDVLPLLADSKGRVHTTFNQAVTATGRLSSSNPNLQNVPARTEEGMRIREAFVAEKGFKLIAADYSQIELRILAHISGEASLLEAFEKGVDVHKETAARIFGVEAGNVDSKMRGAAKTVNFGVLYGQGAYGLSQQLDISVEEADDYIKNYYKSYPAVEKLKEKILRDAEKNGYVETLFGRRRYIPDIKSLNKSVKAFAERTAFNAVFQGTAADIIKKAMIELDEVLDKDFKETSMLLQVHDELVFEIPEKDVGKVVETIKAKMTEVISLKVPLEVDVGVGNNWAECK